MPNVILEALDGARLVIEVPKDDLASMNLRHDGGLYTRVGQDDGGQHHEDGTWHPLWVYRYSEASR